MLAYDYPLLGVFLDDAVVCPLFHLDLASHRDIERYFPQPRHRRVCEDPVGPFRHLPAVPGDPLLLDLPGQEHPGASGSQRAPQEQEFREYVQDVASGSGRADQLAKLADLKDRGVLTDAEFEAEKAKILS